jgi:catechol 2,3-dioxygenase-like lactoylglutathione lyase family enzyme
MAIEFERLIPVFYVADLETERDFYMRLGFNVTYEAGDFVALQSGDVEFGLEARAIFNRGLPEQTFLLQFGIADVDAAKADLAEKTISFQERKVTLTEDQQHRILSIRSPNGYTIDLEGPREA